MKMGYDDRTLQEVANEFLALKKAQKVRERTLCDYKKYIDKFLEQSANSLDVDILKVEFLQYFADIPTTSPATGSPTLIRLRKIHCIKQAIANISSSTGCQAVYNGVCMAQILTALIPVFGTSATPPVTPSTVLYRSHPKGAFFMPSDLNCP